MKSTSQKKSSDAQLVRLNKFISSAGVASRRKADELIQEGKVKVNGKTVTELGMKIHPTQDKVFVNGKQAAVLDEPVYILFNKPKDAITTSNDERGRATIMDYVRVRQRVFPVGRLDRNTTGVLLLTNDGEFANQMMHPRFEIQKAYKVTLSKPLSRDDATKLAKGIRLSDGMTSPAEVFFIPGGKNKVIGIVIHEGRNRQVHRMFEALGHEVSKLDRVGYAGLTYEGLPRGKWRFLTQKEIIRLKKTIT
jgi:23S rRNA pseudouridine2605 synthase